MFRRVWTNIDKLVIGLFEENRQKIDLPYLLTGFQATFMKKSLEKSAKQ